MDSFYQQVIGLLTGPPGNLAYHLVLVFSIAGAIPGALHVWRAGSVAGRRMLAGLSLLLVVQLIQMATAGLAQFFFALNSWLPPLDRAVTALSLVIFIWVWAFPLVNRNPDFAALLMGLLVLVLFLLNGVRWSSQPDQVFFNGSLPDILWTSFSLLLALIGGLILLVRRPAGFEFGLAQFLLLSLGLGLHLLAPLPEGNYPGAVRLAQLAAFPLLLTLPFRFSFGPDQVSSPKARAGVQPEAFLPLLQIASSASSQEFCRSLSMAVAHALPAELCLLLSPPDAQKIISIHCGYDLKSKEWLGSSTFDGNLVPVLAEALRQSRPLHLPANGNLPDRSSLGQVINRELYGALLAAPVSSPVGGLLLGVVVVSGRKKRYWTASEQNFLAEIAQSLPGVMQRSQERMVLREELDQANQSLHRLQEENKRLVLALQESLMKEESSSRELDELRTQLRAALQSASQLRSPHPSGGAASFPRESPPASRDQTAD